MFNLPFRALYWAQLPAVLGVSLWLAACSAPEAATSPGSAKAGDAAAPAAVPVEVVRPLRRELIASYGGTATLLAEADAEVIARVSGEVASIAVEEGQRVRAGQVLATLDGRQLRLQAAQARAQLGKIDRDYRRQVELNQRGLVAAGAFEGLKFDLDNLRAAADLAELQLSYTVLRAPFDGVVSARRIRLGQNLAAGISTFRITNPATLKAEVFVPERELARLRTRQSAVATIDALAGRSFPAVVTLVAPTVDPQTATFKVTLRIEDPQGELRPGMFTRVGIVFERRPNALAIPRAALLETEEQPSVFIVDAHNKARLVRLQTGLASGSDLEVRAGLDGSESVVVVGQSGLKAGNPVKIVSLAADAPTAKLATG